MMSKVLFAHIVNDSIQSHLKSLLDLIQVKFEDEKPLSQPEMMVKVHAADMDTGQMVRVNGTSELYIHPPKDDEEEFFIVVGQSCSFSHRLTPLFSKVFCSPLLYPSLLYVKVS